MVSKPEKFILEIPIKINEYKSFIEHCCNYLHDVDEMVNDFKKMAKFKLVVMELLTNAMKHGKCISYIEIEKMDDKIVLKKIDNGPKFSFVNNESMNNHSFPLKIGDTKKITAILGNNYKFLIDIKNNSYIEFIAPHEVKYDSILNIPENFGLLIIKQCSDNFYYHYDEVNNLNTFEVVFKFY